MAYKNYPLDSHLVAVAFIKIVYIFIIFVITGKKIKNPITLTIL
jgi:hypothetical protein